MENKSCQLKENDILVIRGLGKFIYKGCGNETRKGRVYIKLLKY
jgi:RNA-binding protein YlmH